MNPQTVSSLEVGHFGNRTGCSIAFDADINLRTDQVKGCVVSKRRLLQYSNNQ